MWRGVLNFFTWTDGGGAPPVVGTDVLLVYAIPHSRGQVVRQVKFGR